MITCFTSCLVIIPSITNVCVRTHKQTIPLTHMYPCWSVQKLVYHSFSSSPLPIQQWVLAVTGRREEGGVEWGGKNTHFSTALMHMMYAVEVYVGANMM